MFGNWQFNMITTFQNGLPYTPILQTSVSNAGPSRPDRGGEGTIDDEDPSQWFDTRLDTEGSPWRTPENFTFGNSGRNILRGPKRSNYDFSLMKEFPFKDRYYVRFRTEFFNTWNHPQFALPNRQVGSNQAGVISETSGDNRRIKFSLRLGF